ncbi:MAG TPA: hypothetical protein VF511_10320 [Chthoniobacterales bacterium]|jgi:hypothetical protein
MHAPRRKTFNSVNAASLARWILLTGFMALTGLIYVYLTLQLHHLGERKKVLENELASLRSQNDLARSQITARTSHLELQRQLKDGNLKMIPIAERNIVRLSAPRPARVEDTLQPVANKRGRR